MSARQISKSSDEKIICWNGANINRWLRMKWDDIPVDTIVLYNVTNGHQLCTNVAKLSPDGNDSITHRKSKNGELIKTS
jgi:hypothetical protein